MGKELSSYRFENLENLLIFVYLEHSNLKKTDVSYAPT